jgi:tetratricopeptide (TPR) repeat protein
LALASWVRGAPLAQFEPGVTYLVEFWGGDPEMGFLREPDFARLQRQHGKQLVVIGVVAGSADYDFEGVRDHYAEHGKQQTFAVGYDGDGKAHAAWLAAGQEPPLVGLVDGKGRLAWRGGFGFVPVLLPKVLAGDADPAALADESAKIEQRITRVMLKAGLRPQQAIAEMDALLKDYPALAPALVPQIYQELAAGEEPALAEPLLPRVCDIWIAEENPLYLNNLAWSIVDPSVAKDQRDLVTALRAAEKAVALSRQQEPSLLDTLARVWFWKEDYKKAVALQRQAIALLGEEVDAEERAAYAASLKEYEELAAGK